MPLSMYGGVQNRKVAAEMRSYHKDKKQFVPPPPLLIHLKYQPMAVELSSIECTGIRTC